MQLLEELRRSPACGNARSGQRCCALAAEASAGRCACRPGAYQGIGTALASMQVRRPRLLPASPHAQRGSAAGLAARLAEEAPGRCWCCSADERASALPCLLARGHGAPDSGNTVVGLVSNAMYRALAGQGSSPPSGSRGACYVG